MPTRLDVNEWYYLKLSHGIYDPPLDTGAYAFFPSWPDKPFLSVAEHTRKEWYEALALPALLRKVIEKPIELDSWTEYQGQKLLRNFEENGQASYLEEGCQYVLLNIRWAQNDQTLIRKFQSWLKKNRPRDMKPDEIRGRG